MSVLIRGMNMPYGCANCPYMGGAVYDSKGKAHYFCNVDVEGIRGTDVTNEVIAMYEGEELSFPSFCPLVEVKEPHGRLIDADVPLEKVSKMMQEPDYQHEGENWMVGLIMARDAIDEADTIIEAEGREE